VIGIEMESESDSENEKKVVKRSEKRKVRTRKVQFEEEGRKSKNIQGQVDELTRKLLQLDVKDNTYAVAYAQLFVLAPNLVDKLPPLSWFGVNIAMTTNTTAISSQPSYPQFNPRTPYDLSCHFCKQSDYRLQTCQIAVDYVRMG